MCLATLAHGPVVSGSRTERNALNAFPTVAGCRALPRPQGLFNKLSLNPASNSSSISLGRNVFDQFDFKYARNNVANYLCIRDVN